MQDQTEGYQPPMCFSQEATEHRMYYGGIKRAETMLARAEEEGRAHNNPYAKEVFRDYVLPLAAAIRDDLAKSAAGRQQAHASLLNGLDLEAVSYLSIRYVFSTQLSNNPEDHRSLCTGIGRTIHQELLLAQVEDFSPELYHTLVRDLGRRLSKDERYRSTVMRHEAQKAGIVFTEWPIGARQQVGSYVLDMLSQAEFIIIGDELRRGYKRVGREVYISPAILERIDRVKSYIAISMPVYGPCIDAPRDWTSNMDGGFHTRELRRANPFLVRGGSAVREVANKAEMPTVLAAVNALQRTAWAVNERMLDAVYAISKAGIHTKEIVSLDSKPKPVPPVWLLPGMKPDDMETLQQDEFKNWKRRVADWHTERKLLATRYARFYSATRQAEEFRHHWQMYFVYFADSRGRLYPMTYGLNPQGSDLGKALLKFAEGKPVDNAHAIRWFHVHGANKWGFDKATLEDRHAWVVARQDELCAYADDPINNRGWLEAGDPLQFLAWCFEYRDWVRDDDGTFLSHLPISMDGSCNGLQNLSALFRDEVGGRATNLTDNAVMEDIYRRVAEAATARLTAMRLDDPDAERLRALWLEHGISRKVVKRSVMTTPYGVTLMSATDYVVDDYLAQGEAPCFDKTEFKAAARVLMKAVWPAIGDVVVKGREAMDWLKKGARKIIQSLPADEEPVITWATPSGFPACQAYFETQEHRINTRLQGLVKIKVLSETEDPSVTKHASGLAPNFVHSMDAAHLHRTTEQAARRGITSLAMIHDDYGTHAADSQNLFEVIRREFVSMYEHHDPVEDLVKSYPVLPAPPAKGSLDIREVLRSAYFFS